MSTPTVACGVTLHRKRIRTNRQKQKKKKKWGHELHCSSGRLFEESHHPFDQQGSRKVQHRLSEFVVAHIAVSICVPYPPGMKKPS